MTGTDRRALVIGGLAVVLAWGGLRGIPSLGRAWRVSGEQLAAKRLLLHETRNALDALPSLENSARGVTARVAGLAPLILSGNSDGVALSDLTGRLGTIVSRHHARLVSTAVQPDSVTAGRLHRLTTNAVVETDFRGLAEILLVLSRDSLVTLVERLNVTALDPAAGDGVPERLQVELRISAWYLRPREAS